MYTYEMNVLNVQMCMYIEDCYDYGYVKKKSIEEVFVLCFVRKIEMSMREHSIEYF